MSWIFGFYSKGQIDTNFISQYHPHPIKSISTPKFYIAAGGNNNTLFYNINNFKTNYFISGVPISEDASKFVCKNDFDAMLNNDLDKLKFLNGHFCGVIIKNDSLNLFTDQLGLREFHIYENNSGWYFSTRLDWLFKLGNFEIDFNEFGSRWLLINQLSNKSIIKKINRLNCGASAFFKNNQCKFYENNWNPIKTKFIETEEFEYKLEKLTLLGQENNLKLSLSLSGGMDSRVLLSLLLNSKYKDWGCYIFQTDDRMDSIIGEKILSEFNISYKLFTNAAETGNNVIHELTDYIKTTYITESGFNSLKLMHYKLFSQDEVIIDGGFGEIWRREFLNRLYHFGKKDIENQNYEKVYNYLTNYRAEIFSEEYNSLMKKGSIKQIEKIFNMLPSLEEIGLGNWLDLFSIKTRLVNYYAPEQARIDNYVTAYMPFAQIYLLSDLLNLPMEERMNNRLFKSIIKSKCFKLSKYNLAKGNLSYPFYFNPIMKRGYSLLYNKFNKPKPSNAYDLFLMDMKEFIFDSLQSGSCKEYAPYNYNLISENIGSYFKGNKSKRRYVDWFLTFEIFRQILENKHL